MLTIRYNEVFLFKPGTAERLSSELTEKYQEILGNPEVKTNSCVVKIDSEVAGSPIVRALFGLWKEVVERKGGQVICIDFPEDYLNSLTTLGLPALNGFSLASTEEEAVERLAAKFGNPDAEPVAKA